MPLRHLRNNIWPQRSIHHPAKHSRRNFLRQQPMTITTKCSTQLCMGSQIQPWDTPDKTQTEHTQVTQKTLTEKATGEKHIIVCLYFSRKIHPISPTFTKLILKTVNGSLRWRHQKKAVPVIYNTVIEKMLTYKWKHGEGRFW